MPAKSRMAASALKVIWYHKTLNVSNTTSRKENNNVGLRIT